jgi:hypothetical protein
VGDQIEKTEKIDGNFKKITQSWLSPPFQMIKF